MSAKLVWNGDKVIEHVANAARQALDETTAAADHDATTDHWWKERTAPRGLVGQIHTRPAVFKDGRVTAAVGVTYSGRKGVFSGFYAWFLEMKTPWFRPAADRNFATLAARFKRRLTK